MTDFKLFGNGPSQINGQQQKLLWDHFWLLSCLNAPHQQTPKLLLHFLLKNSCVKHIMARCTTLCSLHLIYNRVTVSQLNFCSFSFVCAQPLNSPAIKPEGLHKSVKCVLDYTSHQVSFFNTLKRTLLVFALIIVKTSCWQPLRSLLWSKPSAGVKKNLYIHTCITYSKLWSVSFDF